MGKYKITIEGDGSTLEKADLVSIVDEHLMDLGIETEETSSGVLEFEFPAPSEDEEEEE